MQDSEIVDLFLLRDEKAIIAANEKYGSRLFGISKNICADKSDAEECVNDTWLEAWKRIPPAEPKTYLFPFLAKITRAITINHCRKLSAQKRRADFVTLTEEMEQCIPSPSDVESHIDEKELSRAVSDFLRTVPEEKRNIFLRRYWFMDSVDEIAKCFGISDSKVKTTLFRLRNQLREYLVKEGYKL